MLIVGERLNSSRELVLDAMRRRDEAFIISESRRQAGAGAHYLDLNAAALMEAEVDTLEWAIPVIQSHVDLPLAIDTTNPRALKAGLSVHRGRALLNSVTGERERLERFLPIISEYKPRVIALCLDDDGVPRDPDKEVSVAERMTDLLTAEGLEVQDIFIDPLVRPIAVDDSAGDLFLESLKRIKASLPDVGTIAGISNVSYGLPERRFMNRAFLVLAVAGGLDAFIMDPLDQDALAALHSARALVGQDPSLGDYLSFIRKSQI